MAIENVLCARDSLVSAIEPTMVGLGEKISK